MENEKYFDMYVKGTFPEKYSQDIQGLMHYISNRQQVLGANIGLIRSAQLILLAVAKRADFESGVKIQAAVQTITDALELIEGRNE